MKVRCEYCDNLIDDGDEKCPSCGAVNKNYNRSGVEVPKTIEELEQWYKDRGLPPYETTRFFIGIDYKDPKAFGIYKDTSTGKFVVYKNKADGSRAIRYEGTDEGYAVNELYLKLKEEIAMRKNGKKSSSVKGILLIYLIPFIFFLFIFMFSWLSPSNGYYSCNGKNYYNHSGSWYIYENNWKPSSKPSCDGSLNSHYDGDTYYSGSDYTDIRDSDYYDSTWDSDSSWDSDSDWDSGSDWDSSSSDWSSDW